ncbi:MAG TPA: hypothetical protein VGD73_01705 [Pseudonocardia sp.]|uniref:hypothetical protein n=1 Tax=Pseudonocardia sp. TaxID=60912 RepID=UPI002EDA6D5C
MPVKDPSDTLDADADAPAPPDAGVAEDEAADGEAADGETADAADGEAADGEAADGAVAEGVGGPERHEQTLVIGLLADPGLPTELAEYLAEELPDALADTPVEGTRYRFVVVRETLRRLGDARGERMIDLAAERANREGWDFALCLTDMPVHKGERPLVAELSRGEAAAVLVVPALNVLRLADEARELVAGMLVEWAARERLARGSRPLVRITERTPNLHQLEPDDDDDVDVRLTRSAGPLWMLAGMVRVNRPWRLVLGLRSALAAAVATAAFGLVSNPVWQVSAAMSTLRLWISTVVSLVTIICWLIMNHQLWQHARSADRVVRRQIRLYNAATVLTLAIGVLVSYLVLFVGNLLTGWFVVVPDVLSESIRRPVGFADYLRLAWLVSSLATIGGALGSGLESSDTVRSATWGDRYRQNRPQAGKRHKSRRGHAAGHRAHGGEESHHE